MGNCSLNPRNAVDAARATGTCVAIEEQSTKIDASVPGDASPEGRAQQRSVTSRSPMLSQGDRTFVRIETATLTRKHLVSIYICQGCQGRQGIQNSFQDLFVELSSRRTPPEIGELQQKSDLPKVFAALCPVFPVIPDGPALL